MFLETQSLIILITASVALQSIVELREFSYWTRTGRGTMDCRAVFVTAAASAHKA